jgi:hypothetical protein
MPDGQKLVAMPTGERIAFPDTMQDSEINNVLSNWVPGSGMAPKPPVAPMPKVDMQPVMSWSQPSKFETEVGKGMGFDVNKIQGATGKGMPKNQELIRQALSGMGGWAKSTVKDPFHITDPVEGMATGVESAVKSKSPGQMLGAAANVGMGMEAADAKVPEMQSASALKSGVADAAYKRGLGVAENLQNASAKIHDAVGQAAQSFIKKVDEKFPQGAIDPKPIMEGVNQLKADIVKTPEKYPAGLAQMLEPETKQTTGPRVMGGHLDLSDPAQLASYQKMKASGAFTPAEIARMEGSTSDMWRADQAKQWRSKIGAALTKTQGPMKAVLTDAYDNLTQQMRKAADQSGALSDFTDYNNLHKKHMGFLNDPVVSKIMEGTTSKETLGPLSDPEKMAHVQNILDDWDKYGVRTEDLAKEGADYGKAKALMEKQRFKWFPGGTLGGAVGAHMLGLPWGVGAAGGLAIDRMMSGAGKASKFIDQSKVSPFYRAGEAKAADISRGWEAGLPEISAKKIALKKAEGK